MAAKKATKAKAVSKYKLSLADRILECSVDIAARDGWPALRLRDVADALKEPLGSVIAVYPTTDRVASALLHRIDRQVLAQVTKIDDSETPRDRLFEILMMRFDALQQHRSVFVSLIRDLRRRPFLLLMRAPAVVHSMALMLIASGIEASSPIGMARAHVLAAAYGGMLKTWLSDDSSDLAKTMSAVDKALGRLESMQNMVVRPGEKVDTSEK